VDAFFAAATHEIAEAMTDPYPGAVLLPKAYDGVDADHYPWEVALNNENGDLCQLDPGSFVRFPDFPFTVQRTWSNAAAAAGHDPCAPALPEQPYFNAAPVLAEIVTVNGHTTTGVKLGVGESKTIDVQLFSDAPTDPWVVDAVDMVSAPFSPVLAPSFSAGAPTLKLEWVGPNTGNNGDTLHLKIAVLREDSSLWNGMFALVSHRLGDARRLLFWFGAASSR
jgi:hypothetical protein